MPATKGLAMTSLSGLIDSDDDMDMGPSPVSNQENQPHAKPKETSTSTGAISKVRGRPPNKATIAAKSKSAKSKATSHRRAPLQEQANEQRMSDGDDYDDDLVDETQSGKNPVEEHSENESMPKKQAPRKGRPPGKAKSAATGKPAAITKMKATQKDGEFEYTPTRGKSEKAASKSKRLPKPADATDNEMGHGDENTMLSIEEDDVVEKTSTKRSDESRIVDQSSSAQATSRRRPTSASGGEPAGDVTLRRKLGEMTRKFESLESRYRNLKEISVVEAEANFDRLKKQSEQRTKAANDLIESLRSELEASRATSLEAREHNADLRTAQKQLAASEARVKELAAALNVSKKESQNLQAKLVASRTVPDAAQRGKMSATKPNLGTNAEASHSLQVAQLKEDLYSDLTGLIIRGVNTHDSGYVYDCIQTGCNGTLHFKLSVAPEDNANSFEDTEFAYEPRLDRDRDQDLMEIMPDYLSDEISFSRANAAKFYSRIADTLTKRLVDE